MSVNLLKMFSGFWTPSRGGDLVFPNILHRTISYFAACGESTELMHILANRVKRNMKADSLGPERLEFSMKTTL